MAYIGKITILSLLLGFFLYSVGYVSAGSFDWHKPIPCIGCHIEQSLGSTGAGECGGCHRYISDYKLNVSKIQEKHDPKICKACHIGNTIANGTPREIFHSGHSAVDCTRCHTNENITVIKIQNKNFECVSCHGNKIHSIHIENLGRACPICHGSWAKDKVYKKEEIGTVETNRTMTDSELDKFTIFSFIKKLFDTIFGTS